MINTCSWGTLLNVFLNSKQIWSVEVCKLQSLWINRRVVRSCWRQEWPGTKSNWLREMVGRIWSRMALNRTFSRTLEKEHRRASSLLLVTSKGSALFQMGMMRWTFHSWGIWLWLKALLKYLCNWGTQRDGTCRTLTDLDQWCLCLWLSKCPGSWEC